MTSSDDGGIRVLIVDDDRDLVRTLADILRRRGYVPKAASTGGAALRIAGDPDTEIAIALVDLNLPDMDGIDVVTRLKQGGREVEVVVLTGNASVESAVDALRHHSYDYLIKPVAPDHLLTTLQRAAERWHRRRAERALFEREERFRRLIEGISDMILLLDPELRISYVSPAIGPMLGYEPAAVIGRDCLDFLQPLTGSPPPWSDGAGRVEPRTPVELVGRHADGSARLLQVTVNDQRGHPAIRGLVLTARDVSEQRRLEKQAMQANRLDSIGRLAGGLAHDFNNILSIILGATTLARLELDDPTAVERHLSDVQTAGERAARLTRQLLSFAKRQPGEVRVVDVVQLVRETRPLLRRLIDEDIGLVEELQSERAFVLADPSQIEQVLMNLAANARDAIHGRGRITVGVARLAMTGELQTRHQHLPPGDYVCLTVRDTGSGMSDEVLTKAMEPFFSTKDPGQGTGLGLSICYGIARQLGGGLGIMSRPGHGTTVEFVLPHRQAAMGPESPPQHEIAIGKGEQILLVEDELHNQRVVAKMLETLGYRVVVACHGKEALRVLGRQKADMILTDVVMPELGGPELVERLRARNPEVRVLYMSGYPATINGRLADPTVPLLSKPFTLRQLSLAIRAVLDADVREQHG